VVTSLLEESEADSKLHGRTGDRGDCEHIVKVNIGSGPVGRDDWINLDYGLLAVLNKYRFLKRVFVRFGILPDMYRPDWPRNLVLHDCRRRLPFKDESVDYVYTSHLLEHLKRFEAARLLRECYRVLKPKGYMRIVVPDLELLARRYLAGDREFFLPFQSDNEEMAECFLSFFYPPNHREPARSFLERLQLDLARWHRWMYDYESLSSMLRGAGFVDIARCRCREGKVPDIASLDIHERESLFVEARKPPC
jgi:SAM-dependent methyltransferase